MLRIECDEGRVKVSAKVSQGIGQICTELTLCIRGIIDSMEDPKEREQFKMYASEIMPKLILADSMDAVLDELIEELIWGHNDETEHKPD